MSASAKKLEDSARERPILFSGPMVRAILSGTKTQTRRAVSPQNSLVNGYPAVRKGVGLDSWHTLDFNDTFVDNGPSPMGNEGPYLKVAGPDDSRNRVYSRVMRGDVLWVKETCRAFERDADGVDGVLYAADSAFIEIENSREAAERWGALRGRSDNERWKPSIFMPRWASRLTLEVTAVRVERLADISERDAEQEGARAWLSELDGRAYDIAEESRCRWTKRIDPTARVANHRGAFAALWERVYGNKTGHTWKENPWVWVIEFRMVP